MLNGVLISTSAEKSLTDKLYSILEMLKTSPVECMVMFECCRKITDKLSEERIVEQVSRLFVVL